MKTPRILAAGIASLLLTAATLHAQTWDAGGAAGGPLLWSTGANWDTNVAPVNNGTANVTFGGLIDLTPDMDASWSVNSLTFNNTSGAFTLGSVGGFTLTTGTGGITNNDNNAQTITNAIALGAAQTWNSAGNTISATGAVNNGGNLLTLTGVGASLSGAVSGAGGLTVNGGTVTLSGAAGNTFSGPTTVNGGVLILQKNAGVNALGGALAIGDGTGTDEVRLGANNQIGISTPVTVASSGLFNLNGFSDGYLQLAVTGGSVTIGAGTLTLSTSLTMTGGSVSSTSGTLLLQGLVNTNAAATSATISGNVDLAAVTRTFTIADGAAAIDLDVSAVVSNGSIAKAGAGALRLSGANTFAGNFDLNAGAVLVGNNAAFGTSIVQLNGGSIEADGGLRTLTNAITLGGNVSHTGATDIQSTGAVQITGNRTFTVTAAAATFFVDGSLTESAGGFTFTKDGAGTLTLSTTGANTFAGTTVVNAGLLRLAGSTNTVRGNAIVGDDIGGPSSDFLRLDASNQIADSATVEVRNSGNFFIGAFSETISGLTMKGGSVGGASGTLTIAGSVISLADASSAQITPNVNLGGAVRTFTIADGAAVADLDVTSTVSSGGVIKDGGGLLRFGGNNTYTAGTSLTAGTLAVGSDTALGTGTVTLSGGTLSTDGALRTLTNAISLNGTTKLTGAGGFIFSGPVTLAGGSTLVVTNLSNAISGVLGGAGILFKQGTGTLVLNGASGNTFTNSLTVEEGLLALNKSSGNAVTGFLSIANNLSGTPEVRHFANNQIADSVGVSVTGGLLNLSGFSDTIGALTVNGGQVATGVGNLTLGGNFNSTSGILSNVSGNLNLGGATRTFTVMNVDISAVITNGGLIKDGLGALRLVGPAANGFTQSVTVNTGELRLGKSVADSAIINVPVTIGDGIGGANADVVRLDAPEQFATGAIGTTVTLNSSGLLNLNGFNETIGSLVLAGGNITTGAGILTIASGRNVISIASGTTATISGNLNLSGETRTFTVAASALPVDLDIPAVVANGALTKDGAGVLRLGGNNTFTGDVTVNGGTVLLGSDTATGTGDIVLAAGTVSADGGARTFAENFLVIGAGIVAGAQSLTLNGIVSIPAGTSLAKNGTGTLTIGPGFTDFSGEVTLSAGTLAFSGSKVIQPTGSFSQNGGTVSGGTLVNQGTFTYNGGTFSGLLANQGNVNFNADFTAAIGITNSATMGVGSGITVAANGPGFSNDGTFSLGGGTLSGTGPILNNNFLTGFGTISGSGGFTNSGFVSVSGGNLILANTGLNTNAGNLDVPIARQLRLDAPLTNSGTITIAATTINGVAVLTNSAGGIVTGRGTISAPIANTGGTLLASGGTLTVSGNINNSGILRSEDGAALSIPTITNQSGGEIILLGSLSTSGALTNNPGARISLRDGTGRLLGAGALGNSGLISGDGTISKAVTNNAAGELRAEDGKTLILTGTNGINAGKGNLQGGTLEFSQALTNSASGTFQGRGTLSFGGGLTNQGAMNFSAGTTDVFGNINMTGGTGGSARVISSGGGTTTFYNGFVHNGAEVRASDNSTVVFFGAVTGSGPLTGSGTISLEGSYNPGGSPAIVSIGVNFNYNSGSLQIMEIFGEQPGPDHPGPEDGYDKLLFTGAGNPQVRWDGTLRIDLGNNFHPLPGMTFDLFDFDNTRDAGAFSALTVNDPSNLLAPGLSFDFSQLYVNGTVSVVPEPSSALLLALAGLSLLRRRRP